MGARVKREERLDDASIDKVLHCFEQNSSFTKKDACAMLNIAYNTTRLDSLLKAYKDKKAKEREYRAKKAYTPATAAEIDYVVTSYLGGDNVANIARNLYRSAGFVDRILDSTGTPRRSSNWSYSTPNTIPDAAVRDQFSIGEKVWSTRYESVATVVSETDSHQHPFKVYKIYLEDEAWQQFAFQPVEELASLAHLTKYGIKNQ